MTLGFENRRNTKGMGAFKDLSLIIERENPMIPQTDLKKTAEDCRLMCDEHYKGLFIQKPKIGFAWVVIVFVLSVLGGAIKWGNDISTSQALVQLKLDEHDKRFVTMGKNISAISPAIIDMQNMLEENNRILKGRR